MTELKQAQPEIKRCIPVFEPMKNWCPAKADPGLIIIIDIRVDNHFFNFFFSFYFFIFP